MEKNTEKEVFIEKLSNQIIAINKLKNLESSVISTEIISQLDKFEKEAIDCKRKLEKGEFEIAIIGLEKSGKSTFANSIIQNTLLPTKDAQCTYTSTSIEYGENEEAVVEFWTHNEFVNDFKEKLDKIGIKNANTINLKDYELSSYQTKFKEVGNQIYKQTLNNDIENIIINKNNILELLSNPPKHFSGSQLESEEFKNYIQSPKFAVAVKQITIKTSKLKGMKNAILYDVPGFDSATAIHKEQTKKFMKKADAVVMVARANEPTFKGVETVLFDEYIKEADEDGITLSDKMFPFANKADFANSKLNDNENTLKEQLKRYCKFEKFDRIVLGSAQGRLEELKLVENAEICKKLEQKGIDNGVVKMITKLENYNKEERFPILQKRVYRLQSKIEGLFTDILEKNKDFSFQNFSAKNDRKIFSTLKSESQKYIKKNLSEYLDEIKYDIKENPLSKSLKENLNKWMKKEDNTYKHEVTDEELEKFRITGNTTTISSDNLQGIEKELREEKQHVIKTEFSNLVLNLANEKHSQVDDKIKEIFLKGLQIDENNGYKNELVNKISNYLKQIKNNIEYNGYYNSLIDRFANNLIEILINKPFAYERFEYFKSQISNFYLLASVDDGMDSTITISEQPLLYLLLKHEDKYQNEEKWEPVFDTIKKYIKEIPQTLIPILLKLFIKNGEIGSVVTIVEKCLKTMLSSEKTDEQKLDSLKNRLEDVDDIEHTSLITSCENFYPQVKDIKQIQNTLNDDIKILNRVLIHVVVKAIYLETPFITLVNNLISKIIYELNSDNFDNLINDNIEKIKSEEYKQIGEKREEQEKINQAIKIIKNTLEEMKSTTKKEE